MGEVTRQPGISRNALAAKVCDWTGWHSPRGQPQLASARKALGRLDRCGAIRLPAAAPAAGSGPDSTPRAPCSPPPVALAQLHGELSALGPVEVVAVDSAELRAVYSQLMQHHALGEQRLCGAQMRYLFRSTQGWQGAAAFQSAKFALQAREHWIGWSENVRRGNLARVVCNARFADPAVGAGATPGVPPAGPAGPGTARPLASALRRASAAARDLCAPRL